MKFIGLRLDEHDSNVSYFDGSVVRYYNSERDYQIKHHGFNDHNHWIHVLKKWNVNPSEIGAIAIVQDDKGSNDDRLYKQIVSKLFNHLGFDCPVWKVDHHYAHHLSTWTLGINPTVGVVFDGFGDDFITHSIFRDDKRIVKHRIDQYKSLGMILSTVGKDIKLKGDALDHAGKIMAMKAFGDPYVSDKKYDLLNYYPVWSDKGWKELSYKDSKDFKEICNLVSEAHTITEQVYVDHFLEHTTRDDIIAYSGGIAQNTVINSELRKVRPALHIPPHCNDAGLSLGCVEFLRRLYDQEEFDTSEFPFWQEDEAPVDRPSDATIKHTAELLARGKVIAWYQGHGEVGPRALGNRSILMSPTVASGKNKINMVKKRERFRPFGASVLEDKASEYFDFPHTSPYMLYVMNHLDTKSFPAVTHVDGTCRAQTVSKELETYYALIEEFGRLTGVPMLLNTSLNVAGKPICGTKANALQVLCDTKLNTLVYGDEIIND
tara:strand:+ start:1387 stop:2859 length:1473 start_codon:yes stop_codon:yes gene_type:complete